MSDAPENLRAQRRTLEAGAHLVGGRPRSRRRSPRRHGRNSLESGKNRCGVESLRPCATALNRCRDNRCAGRVVLEVDVAITTSGSSQAFRSVDHHVANKNCAHALRGRPASGDGLEIRAFHYQLSLVHRHLQDPRPISSPSACACAHLVLVMSALLKIRRSDLNSRVTKSQLRTPQCLDHLRIHNSRLLRTAAQMRISH